MVRYKIICKLYFKGTLIAEDVDEVNYHPPFGFGLIINTLLRLANSRNALTNGVLLYSKDCKVKVKVYEIKDGKSRLYLKKTFKSYTDYGYVECVDYDKIRFL